MLRNTESVKVVTLVILDFKMNLPSPCVRSRYRSSLIGTSVFLRIARCFQKVLWSAQVTPYEDTSL